MTRAAGQKDAYLYAKSLVVSTDRHSDLHAALSSTKKYKVSLTIIILVAIVSSITSRQVRFLRNNVVNRVGVVWRDKIAGRRCCLYFYGRGHTPFETPVWQIYRSLVPRGQFQCLNMGMNKKNVMKKTWDLFDDISSAMCYMFLPVCLSKVSYERKCQGFRRETSFDSIENLIPDNYTFKIHLTMVNLEDWSCCRILASEVTRSW